MTTQWFKNSGDRIILLGETREDLGGTEYLKVVHYREQGSPPLLNFEVEKALQGCLLKMIQRGWIQSAPDCSDGGLAVTLAECCFSPLFGEESLSGADVQLVDGGRIRTDALLFGETPSRVVISVSPNAVLNVLSFAEECGVLAADIGQVGGQNLSIRVGRTSKIEVDLPISELFEIWNTSIKQYVID